MPVTLTGSQADLAAMMQPFTRPRHQNILRRLMVTVTFSNISFPLDLFLFTPDQDCDYVVVVDIFYFRYLEEHFI